MFGYSMSLTGVSYLTLTLSVYRKETGSHLVIVTAQFLLVSHTARVMWPECCHSYFQYVIACFVIVLTSKYAINRVFHSGKARELREKSKKKRDFEQDHIQKQIDVLSKELDQSEVESVLKFNGPALLEEIRSKRLDPKLVLKAYLYKACKVTKKLNCVTEVVKDCTETVEKLNFDEAHQLPFFGIPVSFKECFHTKGAPSTMGWAKLLYDIPTEDCVIAKVLKQCGAVPFVKTNVPHMTLSFEGRNPIYGEVSNPHNPDFTAGGSSSGEGALIGAGASILGFGSDAAGSIRCPSHMNGIVGLKPTSGRLSFAGYAFPMMPNVDCAPGPMGRDVDTIVMAMRVLCSDLTFKLDPTVVPIEFREELYNRRKPMRIGYFDDNGFIKPIPACQRAVRLTKKALEDAGHTLIPFEVPDVEYVMDIILKNLVADGGRSCVEKCEDEPVDKYLQGFYDASSMSWWMKKIYAAYLGMKCKREGKAFLAMGGVDDSKSGALWKTKVKLEVYKGKFWKLWTEKHNLDAMICPAYPVAACLKGKIANLPNVMSYTVLFNGMNYPAGIVPVTKVTKKDIDDLEKYEGHYKDDWDEYIKTSCTGSINMPVGVQCVSSPYNEETCLRLMKEVETLLPMKKD